MTAPPEHSWPGKRLRFLTHRGLSDEQRRVLASAKQAAFLPMEAIGNRGELDSSVTRDVGALRNGYTLFFDGDVLVAKITPCFENGKGALVHGMPDGIGFGTTELHVLRPTREIDGRFLYYVSASDSFRRLGEAAMYGAAGQKRVPEDFVRDYRVSLPPITSQRAIADYLDREIARFDRLVAVKTRMLHLLDRKRRTLITSAVTRGLDPDVPFRDSGNTLLGEIPAHWMVTRLKFVGDVRTGLALGKKTKSFNSVEYPYLSVANVQDGHLDLSSVKTVRLPKREAESFALHSGDVLMNEGGDDDKLGRGCIWRGEMEVCLHQNHVFAVRPRGVRSEWLNLWTSSEQAKSYFLCHAKRATNLASISASNVRELPLPIPPVHEQDEIVDHVTAAGAALDRTRTAAAHTVYLLDERRAALISAAVTGQIDIGSAP